MGNSVGNGADSDAHTGAGIRRNNDAGNGRIDDKVADDMRCSPCNSLLVTLLLAVASYEGTTSLGAYPAQIKT
jgi:hypothetical protein